MPTPHRDDGDGEARKLGVTSIGFDETEFTARSAFSTQLYKYQTPIMASSAGDQSPEANGSGTKRKSSDAGGQARAKRNRYISIAWYATQVRCLRQRLCILIDTPLQQRVQAAQDQMQWPGAVPALRQPQPRMRLRAQLLRCQLQRVRVCHLT